MSEHYRDSALETIIGRIELFFEFCGVKEEVSMLDFLKPRHLRYRSMEEWREKENIRSFRHPENPELEKRLTRQLEELRKHLWKKHLAQLSPEERKQIKKGDHPSQSHMRIDQAKPIFDEFRLRVQPLPYVSDVTMVARQMHADGIVIRLKLAQDVSWRVWREHIPTFFRGFEIQVTQAALEKPDLTRENAEKLIPNGMTEAQVYAHLGTKATISLGKNGYKFLAYSFHLPPAPPRVDPKIEGITVVLNNGVVVERQFTK